MTYKACQHGVCSSLSGCRLVHCTIEYFVMSQGIGCHCYQMLALQHIWSWTASAQVIGYTCRALCLCNCQQSVSAAPSHMCRWLRAPYHKISESPSHQSTSAAVLGQMHEALDSISDVACTDPNQVLLCMLFGVNDCDLWPGPLLGALYGATAGTRFIRLCLRILMD